jgi:hypothetical protein
MQANTLAYFARAVKYRYLVKNGQLPKSQPAQEVIKKTTVTKNVEKEKVGLLVFGHFSQYQLLHYSSRICEAKK